MFGSLPFEKRPLACTALIAAAVFVLLTLGLSVFSALTSSQFREAFNSEYARGDRVHNGSVQAALATPTAQDSNPFATWAGRFSARTISTPVDLFTGLLFVATLGLWIATLSMFYEARRSSERQLRAYIGVVRADISFDYHGEWSAQSTLILKNFGSTPAHNARVFGVLEIVDAPFKISELRPIDDSDKDASQFTWGPGVERLKIDELDDLQAKWPQPNQWFACAAYSKPAKRAIVAHGIVRYEDAFGKPRTSEFCYYAGYREGLRNPEHGTMPVKPVAEKAIERVEEDKGPFRLVAHADGNNST